MLKPNVATVCLGLLVLGGCGLSPRAYCEEIAQSTCERLFTCTTGEAERSALLSVYPDEATCVATFKTRSTCETQTESSLCRGNRWVPAKAARCVAELQTLPCDQVATYRPTCAPPCE